MNGSQPWSAELFIHYETIDVAPQGTCYHVDVINLLMLLHKIRMSIAPSLLTKEYTVLIKIIIVITSNKKTETCRERSNTTPGVNYYYHYFCYNYLVFFAASFSAGGASEGILLSMKETYMVAAAPRQKAAMGPQSQKSPPMRLGPTARERPLSERKVPIVWP